MKRFKYFETKLYKINLKTGLNANANATNTNTRTSSEKSA